MPVVCLWCVVLCVVVLLVWSVVGKSIGFNMSHDGLDKHDDAGSFPES